MFLTRGLALVLFFFLIACKPTAPATVTILDSGKVIRLQSDEHLPSVLLSQAGITLGPNDRLLAGGIPVPLDRELPEDGRTLQVRRAVTFTLTTGEESKSIQSSALTLGEALAEASIWLREGDKVYPALNAPLIESMQVDLSTIQQLTVSAGGKPMQILASGGTVGAALAEAGIPLVGLDYSVPAENEPLPADGQIRVVRVSESLQLAQKPIPFESEVQTSAEVPLDQTQILQPGEPGLSVQRIRIRYEDGEEVARVAEEETLVRPPKTRLLGTGTKVEIRKAVVDGVEIEYWRAVQMYATSYSPCRSGGDRCYTGTSSGKSLRKGMVGMRYDWYLAMGGQSLYIPGYGFATVEDVCGGCTGKPWIDLGYSDSDWQQWSSWVTVYFLTPVPSNILYDLQ